MGRLRDAWNALRGYAAAQDSRASAWAPSGGSRHGRGRHGRGDGRAPGPRCRPQRSLRHPHRRSLDRQRGRRRHHHPLARQGARRCLAPLGREHGLRRRGPARPLRPAGAGHARRRRERRVLRPPPDGGAVAGQPDRPAAAGAGGRSPRHGPQRHGGRRAHHPGHRPRRGRPAGRLLAASRASRRGLDSAGRHLAAQRARSRPRRCCTSTASAGPASCATSPGSRRCCCGCATSATTRPRC